VLEYDSSTKIYHLLNTLTGIQTDWTCSGGSGYNCAGGTRTAVTKGLTLAGGTADVAIGGATQGACAFVIHNAKASINGLYTVITDQGGPVVGCAGASGFYVWRGLQTPFDVTTQLLETGPGLNHWAVESNHVIALANMGFASTSGVYFSKLDLANPTATVGNAFFQVAAPGSTAPNCTAAGSGPPCATPVCTLANAIDNHISAAYAPDDTDTWPTVGATYNYATLDPHPFQAYQDEIIGSSTNPTWTCTPANCSPTPNAGAPPNSFPVTPTGSPRCLGGYPWLANTQYHVGDMIHPIGGTAGGGAHYPVFMATSTSGTGTSQATAPTWPTQAAGVPWPTAGYSTVTDNPGANQIVWTEMADKTDCRGNLLVFKLR